VTVDVESLTDGAATIRERDSMTQERVALDAIPERIGELVAGAAWTGRAPAAESA
jgi:glycyl-tRNA synthetase